MLKLVGLDYLGLVRHSEIFECVSSRSRSRCPHENKSGLAETVYHNCAPTILGRGSSFRAEVITHLSQVEREFGSGELAELVVTLHGVSDTVAGGT